MKPIANAAQFAAWNGEQGRNWVEFQREIDAFLAPFDSPLLDAINSFAPRAILDVGCGCGPATRLAARRVPDGSLAADAIVDELSRHVSADGCVELLGAVWFVIATSP